MKQVIGIDIGRTHTKIYSSGRKFIINSVVGTWLQRNISRSWNYEVEINGERKFIGDLAIRESRQFRKLSEEKLPEDVKVLFLAGISLVAEQEDLTIVTGTPIKDFTPEKKQELVQLLKGNHIVKVGNGLPKSISINDLIVAPEGACTYHYLLTHKDNDIPVYQNIRDQIVKIIDLGTVTINVCTVYKGSIVNRDSDSLTYGMSRLIQQGREPSEDECRNFTLDILTDLSNDKQIKIEKGDRVFITGGGAFYLRKWFQELCNAEVIQDNLFSNVIGFYQLGMKLCQIKN